MTDIKLYDANLNYLETLKVVHNCYKYIMYRGRLFVCHPEHDKYLEQVYLDVY